MYQVQNFTEESKHKFNMPRRRKHKESESSSEIGKNKTQVMTTRSKGKASMVMVANKQRTNVSRRKVASKAKTSNNNALPDYSSDEEIIFNVRKASLDNSTVAKMQGNDVDEQSLKNNSIAGDGVDVDVEVPESMDFDSDIDEQEIFEQDDPEENAPQPSTSIRANPQNIKAMLKELLSEELSEIKATLKEASNKKETPQKKVNRGHSKNGNQVKSPSDTTLYHLALNRCIRDNVIQDMMHEEYNDNNTIIDNVNPTDLGIDKQVSDFVEGVR